jgi:hypothetical protein
MTSIPPIIGQMRQIRVVRGYHETSKKCLNGIPDIEVLDST